MAHSKTSITYRIRGLKPTVLRTLEDRLVAGTDRITDFILLYLFWPYARYAITPLARILVYLLPVLVLALVPITLLVGVSTVTSQLSTAVTTVLSSPVYTAAVLTGVYSLSLLAYRPTDKMDYTGRSMPTNPNEWELMFLMMGIGMFPISYFLLQWHPDATRLISLTGQSSLILGIAGGILGQLIVTVWYKHRYTNPTGGVSPNLDMLYGAFMFSTPFWCIYLALIAFNIDILVFGPSDEPMMAAFLASLAWSALVLRRLRWSVYEDWAGFRTINPFVPVWGVARLPFMFTVFAFWAGAPLSLLLVIGALSPYLGGFAYIGWRLWVTADLKVHPNGGPGEGRRAYKRVQKQNNQKIKEIYKLKDAVDEFNAFASQHDIDILPDGQGLKKYNPKEVKKALNEIDKHQARQLTGDDFTEYAELRDKVRKQTAMN